MSLSITYIVKNSAKFSLVSAISKVASILVGIITAIVLIPADYGIIGLVTLWSSYANLISLGTCSAAYREMPYLLGKGNEKKAVYIQNIAISSDLLVSILLFVIILFSAMFFRNSTNISIGLILVALSYIITKGSGYWAQFNYARNKFNEVAFAHLITGIGVPVLTVALIFKLKLYAILIAPVVAGILSFFYFLKFADIGFRFKIDKAEIRRQVKIGFPIAIAGIIYWAYRLIDKTLVAKYFSLTQLGFYAYPLAIVGTLCYFFSDFCSVLQAVFWRDLGKSKDVRETFNNMRKITIFLALASAVTVGLSQEGFYILVNVATPRYIPSITVFNILSYGIFFHAMTLIPCMVMNSSVVNKQNLNALVWAGGLVANILAIYTVVMLNLNTSWVAGAAVLTWFLIMVTLFVLTFKDMHFNLKESLIFFAEILLPLITLIFIYLIALYVKRGCVSYIASFLILIIQLSIWVAVIRVFYRKYLPKEQLIKLWKYLRLPRYRGGYDVNS